MTVIDIFLGKFPVLRDVASWPPLVLDRAPPHPWLPAGLLGKWEQATVQIEVTQCVPSSYIFIMEATEWKPTT